MAKVGRNEPCPCGSGLKHKKCCLAQAMNRSAASTLVAPPKQTFTEREIDRLQKRAAERRMSFRLIGALVFFSTAQGDAWLLELTESDALPVARTGEPLPVTINETEEVLEIGWTHSFALADRALVVTAYENGAVSSHADCPVGDIRKAMQNLRRQHSRGKLESIRIRKETEEYN